MRELKIKPPPGFEIQTEEEVFLPPGFELETPKKKVPTEGVTDGLSAPPTGQDLSDGSQTTPPISGSESFQGTVSEQELSRINDFIKNAPTAKPIDVEKINVVEKITKDRNILDQEVTETGVTLTPEDEYIAQAPKAYEDEMAIILYNALDRGVAQGDIASEMTAVGGDPTDFQAIAQAQRTIEARKGSAVYNAYNNAKTSKEAWDIMTSTPGGFATILTEWGLQSLSAMLRHGISRIAVGSGAGAAMGSVIPGAGTLAGAGYGAATGMGATSLNLEYSGKMLEVFSEMGVDTTDPKQLENIFTDEQKLAEARSKALRRGVPIAIFDAVSGGVAGKLVSKPAKTIAGKGLKWLSETGIQMSFDAAGEVSGQALSGEDISIKEVIPEVLGGLPIDVAVIGIGSAGRSLQQKMRMETFRNVGSIPQGVDKVAVMKEQIEFNLASGQITPEVADQIAQDVSIAVEVDKTIPVQIQGEQRAASLPILVEKKELEGGIVVLEQEKEVTDPSFHSVIDDEIKAIQEAVKEKDNAIKNIITAQPEAVTTEGAIQTIKQDESLSQQSPAEITQRQQTGDSQEVQQGDEQSSVQETAKEGEEKVTESTLITNQDEKQNNTRGDISSTSDQAQLGSDSRNEKVASELQGRIRAASEMAKGGQRKSESEEVKPIRQLGTGANVYYETTAYRVNDAKGGKVLLNIQGTEGGMAIANIEFDNPREAVQVAKKINEIYPKGVPDAVLIDKVVEDIQKNLSTPTIAPVNAASGFVSIPTTELATSLSDFQGRKGKFSEQTRNRIVSEAESGELNLSAIPPIQIWKDPRTGKWTILGGHSRTKAFEELASGKLPLNKKYKPEDFKNISAQVVEASTLEQAQKIAQESNQGAQQTEIENAKYVREVLMPKMKGKSQKEIDAALENLYGTNKNRIRGFAALNPNGNAMQALESFASTQQTENADTVKKIAKWVGEERIKHPELTNAHENEMFDFLFNEGGHDLMNQTEFTQRINGLLKSQGFDAPLNLKKIKQKNVGEQQYDAELGEIKNKIEDLKSQKQNLEDRFSNPKNPDYISPNDPFGDYQQLLSNKDKRVAEINQELQLLEKNKLDLQRKKSDAISKGMGQASMFEVDGFNEIQNAINTNIITDEQANQFIQSTENIETDEPIISLIESAAESDIEAQLNKAIREADELIGNEPQFDSPTEVAKEQISRGVENLMKKWGGVKALSPEDRTSALKDIRDIVDGLIKLGTHTLEQAIRDVIAQLRGQKVFEPDDINFFENELTQEKADRGKRRFTQQVLKELPQDVKSAIKEDTIYYDRLPNKITLETAGTILTSLGDAAAITAVQDLSNGMSWPVRNTLGQLLIKKLNQQGDYDAMIEMLDTLTKNATELGQGIQALSMFQYLTAEGQLRIAQKQIDQQRKKRAAKRSEKKRIDKAKSSLKDAVKEAASEAVKTVTGESITPLPSKRKPTEYGTKNKVVTKDRYSAALSRAKKSFFSTPFNEDVLIVATYHLEASGRKFAEFSQSMIGELGKKVRPYLKDLFYKAKERLNEYNDFSTDSEVNAELVNLKIENIESEVKQGLKSINARIADIAKAHFTVYDAAKTSLKEKLMEGVELSEEEASKLASAIEKEFNRVITDKKSKLRQAFLKEKVATKKTVAGIEKKLLELVNIGAFSDSEFMDKWADANDYPKLTKENIDKIKELASKVETAKEGFQKFRAIEDLLAYQAKIKGISFTDIAMSIWYANILSGYTTQMVNIVSTFLNSMALLGVNATRSPLHTFNFAMSYFNGFKTGILEGREVLISGYSPIRGKIDVPATLELVRFRGGKFNPVNYLKYVRRFMVASDVVFFESLKEMKAYQLAASMAAKEGKLNPSLDEKNRASEILNQTDTDYQNNLIVVQNEYDETVDQINKSSLSKSDKSRMLSQAIRDRHRRMYELSSINRDEDLQQESFQYALKGTFNQKPEGTLGALVAGINAALNKVPLARLVVPFTNIIANVANATIDYTPFGFMRAARGGILTKQELTDSDRVELITKASFGLVAMTTVFLLSGSDEDEEPILEITANGTGDYRKNYNLKDWQAYSFRFKNPLTGEKTGWIKYSFSPLNLGFAYIGNLRDAEKYRNKKITDTDWTAFQIALTATSRVLFDMTFLTSINTFLSAIANPQDENTIDNFIKGFQNTAKGFVLPNLYQQGFKQVQEFQQIPFKETNTTMMGWLLKDIPVARNMYQDKINALGEPVIPDMDKFYSSEILPPVIEINDVWKLIAEKGMTNLAVPSIRKIRVGDPATGKETFLTDEEYFEFCKFRGGLIKTTLQNLISHNATSHLDRDWMTTNQKAATKAAKNYIYQLRVDSQKR